MESSPAAAAAASASSSPSGEGAAVRPEEARREARALEEALGHDAGGDKAEAEAAGEVPAAPRVGEAAVADPARKVGVAGPRQGGEALVVGAAGVLVPEDEGEGASGRAAPVEAGEEFGSVALLPGRGASSPGAASGEVGLEVAGGEGEARRAAVDEGPDGLSVRLAEDLDAEDPPE